MKNIIRSWAWLLMVLVSFGAMSAPFTGGGVGTIWASLPPSSSTSLISSRSNAMAGMVGQNVPVDRVVNPAAWYTVPQFGLTSFDVITTTFNSWLGQVSGPFASTQFGHRMVLHASGPYPVSDYGVEVTSSSSQVGGAKFMVGFDTTTNRNELVFSSTFVGVLTNASGGVEKVFNSGERPSQTVYHYWYRFGSTTSIVATSPNSQFPENYDLVARMYRVTNGVEVSVNTNRVATSNFAPTTPAGLVIVRGTSNSVTLVVTQGTGGPFDIQSRDTLGSESRWTTLKNGVMPGSEFLESIPKFSGTPGQANRFYRLVKSGRIATPASTPVEPEFQIIVTNGDDD